MMSANHIWAYVILSFSIVAIGIGIALCLWRYHWNSKRNNYRIYFFAGFLLLSVFLLEIAYTVGLNQGSDAKKAAEIFSGTFQFFSLDADYAAMVQCGPCAFQGWGVIVYYVLFCIYTVVVPIAGGCFIMQFLCTLVPRARLILNPGKTKFVFSELNERSIVLAEDIARLSWELKKKKTTCNVEGIDPSYGSWLKSACMIFTDAYTDKESEVSSELLDRAKRIGAICLKDDIQERSFYSIYPWLFAYGKGERSRNRKKIVYFLMDEKEENNMVTAVSLLSDKRELWKRTVFGKRSRIRRTDNMEMYVFTRNEEAPSIIENAFLHNCEQYLGDGNHTMIADCDKNIIVKTINEYRNLVYEEIFDDRALYDYLVSEDRSQGGTEDSLVKLNLWYKWLAYYRENVEKLQNDKTFQVAIFGGGRIGKEFYKAISWCGQMPASSKPAQAGEKNREIYPAFDLRISVLAENAKDFERELRLEMPELFKNDDTSHCFQTTTFGIGTVGSSNSSEEFEQVFVESGAVNASVILIAFGNDDMNLRAARWVERKIKSERKNAAPVTIFYVIENDALCKVLKTEDKERNNEEKNGAGDKKGQQSCALRVCGSMESRLKLQNILMSQLERRGLQAERTHEGGCKDGKKYMSGYNRESSIAAALHFFNKVFSLEQQEHDNVDDDLKRVFSDGDTVGACVNQLYFLEHRRWCAYMLTQGYRCLTADEFLANAFDANGEYNKNGRKDENLRLHACLLECGADYAPIEVLLKEYARAHLKEFDKVSKEIEAVEQENLGAQQRRQKIVKILKNALSEQIIEIQEKVKNSRSTECGTTLEEWLDEVFPEDIPNGTTYHVMDPLDKLSLVATLCTSGDKFHDYKSYDVKIIRNLYLDVLRQRVMQRLATSKAPLEKDLQTLCDKWMGWENVEAKAIDNKNSVSEIFEYDSVAWSEDFEAILLRIGNRSIASGNEAGKMSIVSGAENAYVVSTVIRNEARFLLIRVPKQGSNCIGSITKGGKKYYIHFFRRRNKKLKLLGPGEKKRAELGTEVDVESRLIPENKKNMSEKQLLKILKKYKEI